MDKKAKILLVVLVVLGIITIGLGGLYIYYSQKEAGRLAKNNSSSKSNAALEIKADNLAGLPTDSPAKDKAAASSKTLDITNCVPSVSSFNIALGESFKFVNKDPYTHKIVIHAEKSLDVAANTSEEVVANFSKGAGAYAYGCDADDNIVGVIVVE